MYFFRIISLLFAGTAYTVSTSSIYKIDHPFTIRDRLCFSLSGASFTPHSTHGACVPSIHDCAPIINTWILKRLSLFMVPDLLPVCTFAGVLCGVMSLTLCVPPLLGKIVFAALFLLGIWLCAGMCSIDGYKCCLPLLP